MFHVLNSIKKCIMNDNRSTKFIQYALHNQTMMSVLNRTQLALKPGTADFIRMWTFIADV